MLVADKPKLFNTQETAEMLGLSPATLEIWRSEGGHGLPYLKLAGGAVRYELSAIRLFLKRSRVPLKGKEMKTLRVRKSRRAYGSHASTGRLST